MFIKLKNLKVHLKTKSGRNNQGKITVWHRGGGLPSFHRFINFHPDLFIGENALFGNGKSRQRSAQIDLNASEFGFFSYTLAKRLFITHKDKMLMTTKSIINDLPYVPLRIIPLGTTISNIEKVPFGGGKICRAAGTYARLMFKKFVSKDLAFAGIVTRRKKRIIYLPLDSRAFLGVVPAMEHAAISWKKAGTSRNRGFRPVVRGVAMNPVDHPHGGGEGKSTASRFNVTPWGKLTKGFKTTKRKKTIKYKLLISKMNKIL